MGVPNKRNLLVLVQKPGSVKQRWKHIWYQLQVLTGLQWAFESQALQSSIPFIRSLLSWHNLQFCIPFHSIIQLIRAPLSWHNYLSITYHPITLEFQDIFAIFVLCLRFSYDAFWANLLYNPLQPSPSSQAFPFNLKWLLFLFSYQVQFVLLS